MGDAQYRGPVLVNVWGVTPVDRNGAELGWIEDFSWFFHDFPIFTMETIFLCDMEIWRLWRFFLAFETLIRVLGCDIHGVYFWGKTGRKLFHYLHVSELQKCEKHWKRRFPEFTESGFSLTKSENVTCIMGLVYIFHAWWMFMVSCLFTMF